MNSLVVRELGKSYNIYSRPVDSLKELLLRRSYHETLWALRDVSFSLLSGGSLGVVGENGAGKTTLLQLLVGTISPTRGSVERKGRISAILELGSGFHPELTGLENIRLGCATLGLSPGETEARIPGIIEFSELQRFIDRPVKTYSTGMHARLAFSVATSVDPDILVVDEALSVGDQHFQKKCMDRMTKFREAGKTLVFCSHVLYFVKQACEQCLWLRNGRLEMLGKTLEVLESYQDYERSRDAESKQTPASEAEILPEKPRLGGDTQLLDVTLGGDCRDGKIATGQTLLVDIAARVAPEARQEGIHMGLSIHRNDQVECYAVSTQIDGMKGFVLFPLSEGRYGIRFVVEELPLLAGQYALSVAMLDGKAMHVYDYWKEVCSFTVNHDSLEQGIFRLSHRWERPS